MDDFYAARSGTIPPLPWSNFAPPFSYILGSVILGWGGEAERAMEWSERGMRLSPFDSWTWAAFEAQATSHMLRGRYEEACRAAYRSVQANPAHSITYVQLTAALPSSVGWMRREPPRRGCSSCIQPFVTAASLPV